MGLEGLLRLGAFAANSLYSKIPGQPRKARLAEKEQAQNLTVSSFIHFLCSQNGVEVQAEQSEDGLMESKLDSHPRQAMLGPAFSPVALLNLSP